MRTSPAPPSCASRRWVSICACGTRPTYAWAGSDQENCPSWFHRVKARSWLLMAAKLVREKGLQLEKVAAHEVGGDEHTRGNSVADALAKRAALTATDLDVLPLFDPSSATFVMELDGEPILGSPRPALKAAADSKWQAEHLKCIARTLVLPSTCRWTVPTPDTDLQRRAPHHYETLRRLRAGTLPVGLVLKKRHERGSDGRKMVGSMDGRCFNTHHGIVCDQTENVDHLLMCESNPKTRDTVALRQLRDAIKSLG
mmetsp:Transcript_10658/g.33886  ORF Transcript_10658/g.33886 Transcript_10658/m.33886 type:complete len:256 (+) Transcript_10658:578-1345(+)